jgi:putative DNA primase/helicase
LIPTNNLPDEAYNPFGTEPNPLPEMTEAEIKAEVTAIVEPQDCGVPVCRYGDGHFDVSSNGVSFINGEGNRTWVCAELRIEAETRDAQNHAWGRLLCWYDRDGVRHTWAMPSELLYGEPADVLRELASQGLTIAPGKRCRDLLLAYLQAWQTGYRAHCVDRLGWHGEVYCTPEETIGSRAGERVIFQSAGTIHPEYAIAGTATQWRASVAALAAGNTRLVLAISAALAGTLLELIGEDSGGLHLVGPSSCGKTTALRVAASVWGKPETFMRQWRATANGLEGLAAVHNDGLLCLDELGQMDPKQAGEAAYMLANGKGKARASRTGNARASASWRLLFLSSGEIGITELIAASGKRANAGQEIRLVNIPADAGAGMGIFETLHQLHSPAAFASAVGTSASSYYGAVGREWLQRIVDDRPELPDIITDGVGQFVAETVPNGASGQVERVARRFGLIAAAGELATEYGLTGWNEGEAADSVRACFQSWLEDYGTGSREDTALLAQVRRFLETHGASRFQSLGAESATIYNRAGFWRDKDEARQFLVLPETFRSEVVTGFKLADACKVLKAAGILQPGKDRLTDKARLPGLGSQWVYVLSSVAEAEP